MPPFKTNQTMNTKQEKKYLDSMMQSPHNWKGPFYFNRKDPRIMVPKYNQTMGWTMNFASPYAYALLIGIVLVVVLAVWLQ